MGLEKEFIPDFPQPITDQGEQSRIARTMEGHLNMAVASLGESLRKPVQPVSEGFEGEMRPAQFEFQTKPTTPLRAVVRMDGQAALLEAQATQPQRHVRLKGYPKGVGSTLNERLGRELLDVDYSPTYIQPTDSGGTSGLHVNFSWWKDDTNQVAIDTYDRRDQVNAIRHVLFSYLVNDLLLIAPNHEAFDRLERYHSTKGNYEFCRIKAPWMHEGLPGPQSRLEFRTPASNARHDLSVLMVLTAIYRGLKEVPDDPLVPKDTPLPTTMRDALAAFMESSFVMKDLGTIFKDDKTLLAHVDALRDTVISAARDDTLAQPTIQREELSVR